MFCLAQSSPDQSFSIHPSLIAAAVSAVVALIVCTVSGQGNQLRFLLGMVQKVIEFSMTYPYLEDDDFCNQWPNIEDREKRLRYDNYCCHVFNTLEHAWQHSQGDRAKMKWIIYPDELVMRHRKWWEGECHNDSGYDPDFCAFIQQILRQHTKGDCKR